METFTFDEIIDKAGGFGRYQKLILFCCVGMFNVSGCFHILVTVFLATVPDHWCRSPPSVDHLNLTAADRLNLTVPREEVDGETVFSPCRRYDRNYTGWSDAQTREALVSGVGPEVNTTTCTDGWEYDQSVYKSTIVTQWDLVCDRTVLVATSTSVYMAGLMVGVLLFGSISDRFGRLIALRGALLVLVTLPIGLPFAPTYVVYICLRFLVATANVGGSLTAFVAGVELVSPKHRVVSNMIHWYYWSFTFLLLTAIAYAVRDWFRLQLIVSILGILAILPAFLIPESPRWLYSQNRVEEANKIVRKIAKVNGNTLPDDFTVLIKKDSQRAYAWDLMRNRGLRWRSGILFFSWFVASMVYYGLIFNTGNIGGNDFVNACISASLEIPSSLVPHFLLRYVGRRKILVADYVMAGLSLLAILAVPKHLDAVTISLAMLGKFFITGAFSTVSVFTAEQFPTVLRNVGVGCSSFCGKLGGVIVPYIGGLITVSRFIPYITFSVLSIAAGVLLLLLPETKDRKLAETIKEEDSINRPPAKLLDETPM